METVLITGGTGLIGRTLSKMLVAKNYRVIVLTRSAREQKDGVSYALWNPEKLEMDPVATSQADHIIHLAGAGVADKRWTKKRKKIIAESRIQGGNTIVKALQQSPNKVQSVVSASGIGWYGPDRKGQRPFKESDPPYLDFLGETCVKWEESIRPVKNLGKRLVIFRTGIVLSNDGGALPEFQKPLKGGVAAILGSGEQMISWIHIDDICRAYISALENKQMQDIYNATAPEVVTNKVLTLKLARLTRKVFLPVHVPSFVLKTVLGEMSIEVLKSTTVDDERLRNSGFQFLYPSIDAALGSLVQSK